MSDQRYSRQSDIVPRERILGCKATIIGVGAIGRQVALQLTAIGIPVLQLIDFDHVELSNLSSQGFLHSDLGRLKVEATAELCKQINPELNVEIIADRFKRTLPIGNSVFVCVDKIETRQFIWNTLKDRVTFLVDGRMSAEVLRVITAHDERSREYYPQTLFSSQQAYTGACTAKTTIYCANIAAGFMLTQFTKYLRMLPVDHDIQLNLLSSEITIGDTG